MNIAVIPAEAATLPVLIDRARSVLDNARGAAEVLEARDMASVAYDMSKRANRLAKAKGACDELIAAGYRVQADALLIEAGARRRLADEYDAAQDRGEIVKPTESAKKRIPEENSFSPATAKDIGLTGKDIYEARVVRDAEVEEPGIISRALDQMLKANEEPTRAKINRIVKDKKKQTRGPRFVAPVESQHDRDLRMLLGVWETCCESARTEFLRTIN